MSGGASKRGSHRLAESALCPRKWYLHNVMGLVPKRTPDHFIEGTLIHLVLAYHYAAKMAQPPAWFHERTLEEAMEEEGRGYPNAIALAYSCLDSYRAHYAQLDTWEPVSAEHEYVARVGDLRRLVNPFCSPHPADDELVTSRIDLVCRINGYIWHVDYKTTLHGRNRLTVYNEDGEYALYWQFLVQTLILKLHYGLDYRGMIVQRIYRKSPFDFDRNVVSLPRQPLIDAADVIAQRCMDEHRIAKQAGEAAAAGRDMSVWLPTGHYWNCYTWGRPCEYRQLCLAENEPALRESLVREYNRKG